MSDKTASEGRVLTLGLSEPDDIKARMVAAMNGKKQGERISFASPDLLWQVLTAKRWDILKVMTGAGPLSVREAARRVGRDVKAVHGDVQALLKAGLIDKTDKGQILFPYSRVHVDFLLRAA